MGFKVKDLDKMREEKEAAKKKPIETIHSETYARVRNIDRLNVRKEPEGEVISAILRNSEVKVLDDPGESWIKIVTPSGLEGWVMRQFVEKIEVSTGG